MGAVRRRVLLLAALIGAALVVGGLAPPSAQAASGTFTNPIRENASDPYIAVQDGWYYLTYSAGTDATALVVVRSRSLASLRTAPATTVWTPGSTAGAPCCHLWAPELHRIGDHWYLYFSGSTSQDDYGQLRQYVLESNGTDPMGPYTFKGRLAPPGQDYKALDGTVYQQPNGQLNFLWSCYPPDRLEGQSICIAPMSNPWTISGQRTKISVGDADDGCTVREGPVVLPRGRTLNLVYSACNFADDTYKLRLQTAPASANLYDPASWSAPSTIFTSGNGVYGPGHNGFFPSPDGTQTWIVYHGYPNSCGIACHPRDTYAQPVSWNGDTVVLGSPVGRDAAVDLPSGDPGPAARYEAEDAQLTNAKAIDGAGASGGRKVGYIDYADSAVRFTVSAPAAGGYTLSIRYANGWGPASHNVSVNGGSPVEVQYQNNGFDTWTTATTPVTLAQGTNTITFTKGAGFAELDWIELTPS